MTQGISMTQDIEAEQRHAELREKYARVGMFWLRLIVLTVFFIWFFACYDSSQHNLFMLLIYIFFVTTQAFFHLIVCTTTESETTLEHFQSYTSLTTYAVPSYVLMICLKVQGTEDQATSIVIMLALFFVAVLVGLFAQFLDNSKPTAVPNLGVIAALCLSIGFILVPIAGILLMFFLAERTDLQWLPPTITGVPFLAFLVTVGYSMRKYGLVRSHWIVAFGPIFQYAWLIALMMGETFDKKLVSEVSWYFIQGMALFLVANSCACWSSLARLNARATKGEAITYEAEGIQIEEKVVEEA